VVTTPSATAQDAFPPEVAAVEADVQLTAKDLYSAEMSMVWRATRPVVIASAAICALESLRRGSLPMLVAAALLGAFCLGAISGLVYMSARSTLRSSRVLGGGAHYSFDERGMRMRGPTFYGRLDWGNIYRAIETRRLILVCPSSAQKYILPKRCFSPEELRSLRELLRARVTGRMELREGREA
jgi:YcxB-like protein